jgi:hypothetical protein
LRLRPSFNRCSLCVPSSLPCAGSRYINPDEGHKAGRNPRVRTRICRRPGAHSDPAMTSSAMEAPARSPVHPTPTRNWHHHVHFIPGFNAPLQHGSPRQLRVHTALFLDPQDASPTRQTAHNPTKLPPRRQTVGSQSITQAFTMSSIAREEGVRKPWGSRQEAVVHVQAPFPFNIARKGNESVRRLSSTFASSPCCRKSSKTPKYTALTHRSKNPAT